MHSSPANNEKPKLKKGNPLDKDLQLPTEFSYSTKNVCGLIRQTFAIEDNQSIKEEFECLVNRKRIEEQLFGNLVDKNLEYFPLRLYVRSNEQDTVSYSFKKQFSFRNNLYFKQKPSSSSMFVVDTL